MESNPTKFIKSSTNIPHFVLRFSKFCKPKITGVSPSVENPKPTRDSSFESCSAEEISDDTWGQKVHPHPHPHPTEETLCASSGCLEEAVILKLFEEISALKLAYVQLQQAHIPYEPNKIKVADELVFSNLESLSKLEDLYMRKANYKPISRSSIDVEIQECRKLLMKLQTMLQSKESDILRLKEEVNEMNQKNRELKEKIKKDKVKKKASFEEEVFMLRKEWTPSLLNDVVKFASKSVHDFAKPMISLMKASGWNLDQAANSIGAVIYEERSDKKYAFEAYLARAMLDEFREECFSIDSFDRIMTFRDPFDALLEDPSSNFGKFCRAKYVAVVPLRMESSFFSNSDQREFVLRGGHPRTPFYRAFVGMARWVWALKVIAHSFIPKAEVFYVKRGKRYSKEYMESVVPKVMPEKDEMLRVEFTVMPGFRIGGTVIPCRVYLSKDATPTENPAWYYS
uniref:Uncharacterized protein n=1 Tax=Ananas comosus var. bracteatus TaxID=296719 RepID=A0A6V7NFW8_ANACO|nr:unnamed protein product [Ananas comosus var. bracteatus]